MANDDAPKKQELIELGRPTWSAMLPMLLALAYDAETGEAKTLAHSELRRMAALADATSKTDPLNRHLLLWPDYEDGDRDAVITVGPFANEQEADAFLERFKRTRPDAYGEFAAFFFSPAEALDAYSHECETCHGTGRIHDADAPNDLRKCLDCSGTGKEAAHHG